MHIGVDIGGTKIEVVAATWDGDVLHRHRAPTGYGNDGVVASVLAAADEFTRLSGVKMTDADTIGVGAPGTVQDGVIGYSFNLEADNLHLVSALEEPWGMRPVLDNDVNCAAVGAWVMERDGEGSIAYLNLGTGLAAGMILNGKLWHGARGAAGEIGYISIDPVGPRDIDGLRGGLETYAGGCGVVLQAQRDGVTAMEVLRRADDVPAWATIRDSLYFGVASAVRVLVLTLDVDEVLLGGGLTGLGDQLLEGTHAVFEGWANVSPFLKSVELEKRVRVVDPQRPVAAIGAAMRGAGRG